MNIRVILIVFLAFAATDSFAQSRRGKKKAKKSVETVQQPTSRDPLSLPKKEYTPKASRKSAKGPTYNLEEEYYERMADVAKERRKAEKIMTKPQYSDPMYFGHKRPPKKRKPSKMKFCKECGIRH